MNIILLSGGSGKRLWPLSNDIRSKQFLKLLKNEQGSFESMVQRVYGQIKKAGIDANIVVAAGASQVDSIRSQLGYDIDIVLEPERRDTFPAIALSCSYLAFEKMIGLEEVVLVLPVDPYAELDYFKMLLHMEEAVKKDAADLILMGIQPTYPSSKYGYILPSKEYGGERAQIQPFLYQVQRFIEKPAEDVAEQLIIDGAVWNGGVFAFKLKYIMNIVNHNMVSANLSTASFEELRNHYDIFNKVSFDYEVVERASSVGMMLYKGLWKDLGTWNSITEEMDEACIGRVMIGEDTINTNVINELSIPIVVLGVKNLVVATSPDGILVADKMKSSYLKSYVNDIFDRPMYEESSWGNYKALDYIKYGDGMKSLTKHLTIKPGQYINYLAHYIRDEIWTILDGNGDMVVDGDVRDVRRGDVVYIAKGQHHAIKAHSRSDLHIIEVQIGLELVESDYEKFEWEWK